MLSDILYFFSQALAAVLAKKSGLDTNAAVISFLKMLKLGRRARNSVLLKILVYFSCTMEMNWQVFNSQFLHSL